jgi:hypothetical protein
MFLGSVGLNTFETEGYSNVIPALAGIPCLSWHANTLVTSVLVLATGSAKRTREFTAVCLTVSRRQPPAVAVFDFL